MCSTYLLRECTSIFLNTTNVVGIIQGGMQPSQLYVVVVILLYSKLHPVVWVQEFLVTSGIIISTTSIHHLSCGPIIILIGGNRVHSGASGVKPASKSFYFMFKTAFFKRAKLSCGEGFFLAFRDKTSYLHKSRGFVRRIYAGRFY